MKTGIKGKVLPIPIILGIALVLNGGFFDDNVAFIGVVIAIALLVMLIKGEAFYARDKRFIFLVPFLIMCIAVVVSFWAVDYMDNFLGVMRVGVVCLWMWLVRSRQGEEIVLTRKLLSAFGCFSVLISLIGFCIPLLKPWFWENSRLSGFFQYANTNALFYAVGIIILLQHRRETRKSVYDLIQVLVLFTGLLLSGSRSVLLLLGLWGVWHAVRIKEFRKPFLLIVGLFLLLGGGYVALTGNTENVGRIFTIFTSNSTLWGRLLYDRDAILLLCSKLGGLGRMGYYYAQGTFQSGIYHIKFVHNDFLQIALDYGVIALVLLLLFLGWQVFRGKQAMADKEILIFMCAASLVDFHFQYTFILMVMCLFADYGNGIREKKAQLKENYIIFPVLIIVFMYVGIATGSNRLGRPDIALSMLPNYSQAQEKMVLANMGTVGGYELATRLVQKNPYNITGHIARSSYLASQLAVKECIEALNKVLELDPYNVEYYKQYELLLQNTKREMESLVLQGEGEKIEKEIQLLQQRINSLPLQLEKMKERTSGLAYKIKDKPMFSYE